MTLLIRLIRGVAIKTRGVDYAPPPKLYIPSALNIDLILWHTQFPIH